jgi:type IV secretory pathway component VirB8
VISRENQKEFESLGVDQVRARMLSSLWSESKLSEARKWLSWEENRIARSAKNAAWIAAIAAIISAVMAMVAIIVSFYK